MSLLDRTSVSETTRPRCIRLPPILAGPILRRATADELVIWLVCAHPVPPRLCCYWDGERRLDMEFPIEHAGHLRIGVQAHLHLLAVCPPDPLPVDRWIEYDIALLTDSGDVWLSEEMPNLTYPGESRMRFVIKTRIDELLFGSCRKPHHDSGDGLAAVPTYMIFDDHDVTDDWNLTRGWEESAYGHPFSRRIIGNALIGYLVCQGWGNAPFSFPEALTTSLQQFFSDPADAEQDALIDNRWLFASHSPLNWLTRRRAFRIRQRRPSDHGGRYSHQRLANGSGIGRLRLNDEGAPICVEMLWINGEHLRFSEGRTTDWVHKYRCSEIPPMTSWRLCARSSSVPGASLLAAASAAIY